jgi:MazG family protein
MIKKTDGLKKKPQIERLIEIMRILRDPIKGCPWDKVQNFSTIAQYTIEEAYEVAEAIRKNDLGELKEELGDLLLQVVFHSRMGEEIGVFNFDEVAEEICEKMIRRHPHVFEESEERNIHKQEASWEAKKEQERKEKSAKQGIHSKVLDDIALALPALIRAQKLSKRAARAGFDWPTPEAAWKKVEEGVCEIQEEWTGKDSSTARLQEEFGDLLFALCSWGRKSGIDAEIALREANSKFEKRFQYVEVEVENSGKSWDLFNLKELIRLWHKGKSSC